MSTWSRRSLLAALGAGALALAWPSSARPPSARPPEPPEGDWLWRDNDFDSAATMAEVHAPIMELARSVLQSHPGPVLDLGCGNGALVDRLAHEVPGCVPYGVELLPERAARARLVCAEHGGNVYAGDMFGVEEAWGRSYALVLLMPGRLLEASPADAVRLRQRLHRQARHVLAYAYDDWLDKAGTLRNLCEAAGLRTGPLRPEARVALCRVAGSTQG